MIKIIRNELDFIEFHHQNTKTIGFVPTMGNLHAGHLSLLEASFKDNEVNVLSIFVNPTQFSKDEDLASYPKTFDADISKASELLNKYPHRELIIFYPENENIIYPKGFNDYISVPTISTILEGEVRPTHFDGVATVVKRLFNIVKPNNAYFGKKDYQQLIVINRMVKQENLDINIVGLPTIREKDNLAMSSRNNYLSTSQRTQAIKLNNSLKEIANLLQQNEYKQAHHLSITFQKEDPRFNYLEIRKQDDLSQVTSFKHNLVILGNFQLGTTRLLDNIEVNL